MRADAALPSRRLRSRWFYVELAALAASIAIAWWLADAATTAWLTRVAKLALKAPAADVRGLAREAALYFTIGALVLAIARAVPVLRRRPDANEPIAVPWLL